MLREPPPKLPIAFIVVCNIIVLGFALIPSVDSQICKQRYYSASENCSPYEVALLLLSGLGHWVKENEGAFTALSTIAIAVFTWRLWVSTEKLWKESERTSERQTREVRESLDIARRSADASVGVDLPRFIVSFIQLRVCEIILTPEVIYKARITASLTNHGRSAANVVSECLVYDVADLLPDKPTINLFTQQVDIDFGKMIEPGKSHDIERFLMLSSQQFQELKSVVNRKTLWAYGFISYRDFLDDEWDKGFVGALEKLPSSVSVHDVFRFVQEGPSLYTYTRRKHGG